jgi:hypothetical protein
MIYANLNFDKEVHQFDSKNKGQIIFNNPSFRLPESLNFGTSHLDLYHPMDKKMGDKNLPPNKTPSSSMDTRQFLSGDYSPKKKASIWA